MRVEDIGNNIIHEAENDVGSNGKYKLKRKRGRKNLIETNVGERQRSNVNKAVRQKVCIEWTEYLHEIFMKAVRQLGEGSKFISLLNTFIGNFIIWSDMNSVNSLRHSGCSIYV